MKHSLLAFIGLAAVLSLTSCKKEADPTAQANEQNDAQIRAYIQQNNLTTQKTADGMYYVINQPNPGTPLPQANDSLYIVYTASRLDGFIIDSTHSQSNNPFVLWYQNRVSPILPNAFVEAIGLLRQGQSGIFLAPSSLAFGSLSDDRYFAPYTPLRFDIQLQRIENDSTKILRYIAAEGLTGVQTTADGLRYVITRSYPDSASAQNRIANVKYTGYFLNGKVFDTNVNLTTTLAVNTNPGASSSVAGFTEGISLMRSGEKAILILPSALGYGAAGSSNNSTGTYTIPPYTPIVFEVEIISLQ